MYFLKVIYEINKTNIFSVHHIGCVRLQRKKGREKMQEANTFQCEKMSLMSSAEKRFLLFLDFLLYQR